MGKFTPFTWRAITLAFVHFLIAVHIIHWLLNGKTLAPLEFNEVFYTLHLGIITAGFILMAVAMLATAIFGRFFCGWACHMLALQDLSTWLLRKINLRPKPFKSRVIIWIPFLVLMYLILEPLAKRLILGLSMPDYRILTDTAGWGSFVTSDLWRNLPGPGISILTFIVCGFLIIYLLGSRSFCQYVCPYGALFAIGDRMAPGKILLKKDACTGCGTCTAVCTSNIQVHKEIAEFKKVVNHDCLKDMDCVYACPENAIGYGFTRPSLINSLKSNKDIFGISPEEEVVIAVVVLCSILIYRGLYDVIPFFLAITIAVIMAFVFVFFLRIFRMKDLQINSVQLKLSGDFTGFGRLFILIASFLIVFTIHSGFVRYYHFAGGIYAEKLKLGERLWKWDWKVNDQETLRKAIHYFESSMSGTPIHTPQVKKKLAYLSLCENNRSRAKLLFTEIVKTNGDDIESIIALARLEVEEQNTIVAIRFFQKAVSLRPDVANLRFELANILYKTGRKTEAYEQFQRTVELDPSYSKAWFFVGMHHQNTGNLLKAKLSYEKAITANPEEAGAHYGLSKVLLLLGERDKSKHHLKKAIKIDPRFEKLSAQD